MTKNELQFFLDVATLAAQAGGAVLKYYLGKNDVCDALAYHHHYPSKI
jgi:hypothetical protein